MSWTVCHAQTMYEYLTYLPYKGQRTTPNEGRCEETGRGWSGHYPSKKTEPLHKL